MKEVLPCAQCSAAQEGRSKKSCRGATVSRAQPWRILDIALLVSTSRGRSQGGAHSCTESTVGEREVYVRPPWTSVWMAIVACNDYMYGGFGCLLDWDFVPLRYILPRAWMCFSAAPHALIVLRSRFRSGCACH